MYLDGQELESISHAFLSCCWHLDLPVFTFLCFHNPCNLVLRFQCFFHCWHFPRLPKALLIFFLPVQVTPISTLSTGVARVPSPSSLLSSWGISSTYMVPSANEMWVTVMIPLLNSRLTHQNHLLHSSVSMCSIWPKVKSIFPSLFLFVFYFIE